MSKLKFLAEPNTRRLLSAVLGQMGYATLLRALLKARLRLRKEGGSLGQHFFLSFWETLGAREAIVDGDDRISFAELRERVLRTVDVLHSLGLAPGEACAVLMYNGAPWFEINQACNLSGVLMPMLNWHLKPNELTACVERAGAKVLIVDPEFLPNVQAVRDALKVEHILVTGAEPPPAGMKSLRALQGAARPRLHGGGFHISAKTYSGGTTGTPKFINVDQEAILGDTDSKRRGASREEAVRMLVSQFSVLGWYGLGGLHDARSGNARSLIPGPLYHAGVQMAVLPFLFGGTAVPMRKFTPEGFLRAVQDERINWTFVVPTMLERILALPDEVLARYRLGSMHALICAAAPCPPAVKQRINALFRRQGAVRDVFHEYYGASETGVITVLLPEDYRDHPGRYASVGKVRAAECGIWDAEQGRWAATGAPGKILLRSALTFGLRYVGEQKMTDDCYREIDGKLWYDDGLIGYLDADDFLYLTSREKEMIITGGVNLFPNEIEDIIKLHPAVLDVAVVRAPDDSLGEVPAAVIELREGAHATAEDILAHCQAQGLYGFKIPRHVLFDALPRNLAGKLPKKQIEARFWEGRAQRG